MTASETPKNKVITEVHSLIAWNIMQIDEMLSAKNRYYAAQKLGRKANVNELSVYYSENGGSEDFAKTHKRAWCSPSLHYKKPD
jgi:hypothetical protein